MFGLQIVTPEGDRLVKGEPGARWMPGQFGLDKGGTPGSVWKIDGTTGIVSLFANIKQDGKDNAGPGLGAITYDPATKQFFVSDLETGLIHRLGLDGSDLGTFDHGTAGRPKDELEPVAYDASATHEHREPEFDIENPATWGFADKRRGVFAVAVQDERVYYSADEGPEIWSVGLNEDGSFADDARLEIEVTGTPNGNVITAIVFDGAGTLYLAQRGEIARQLRLQRLRQAGSLRRAALCLGRDGASSWSEQPDEFAIGLKDPHRSTEGGIALNYGYDTDGNIDYDQCRATLWTTGEHLREGADETACSKAAPASSMGCRATTRASCARPMCPRIRPGSSIMTACSWTATSTAMSATSPSSIPATSARVAEPEPAAVPARANSPVLSPRHGAGSLRAWHLYRQGMLSGHLRRRDPLRDHPDQCRRDAVRPDRSL